MKIEISYAGADIRIFLKYLVLGLIPFWSIGSLVYMFTAANPFDGLIYSWWTSLIFIPIGGAIGYTIGSRKMQIDIDDFIEMPNLKKSVLDFLLRKKLKIKEDNASEITLQSSRVYDQFFNDWFGADLVTIKSNQEQMTIAGSKRVLESLETALRYGKVVV
jgi:hypothetical protein